MASFAQFDGQDGAAHLAEFFREVGPLEDPRPVLPNVVAAYEGLVPDILRDLWVEAGTGGLHDGRFRIVRPDLYSEVALAYFGPDPADGGDRDLGGDSHIVGLTAFGDLIVWNTRHWLVMVLQSLNLVEAPMLARPDIKTHPDRQFLTYILRADPALFDRTDDAGEPMFERALAALGPLQPDEIYAPDLTDPVADVTTVESLVIVDAETWLIQRAMTWNFTLSDLADGQMMIRPVPQGIAP